MTSPELSRLVSACLAAETWNRPTAQQLYDYAAAHIQHKQLPPLTYGSLEEPEPTPAPSPTPSVRPSVTPSVRPSVSSSIRPSVKPSYASSVKPIRQQQQSSGSGLNPFDNPIAKRILIGLAALAGVIILGFGIRSLFSYFSEEQDFVSCQTRQDFEQFIKDHPSSSYVATARKRIEALTPAEKKPETTPKAAAPAVPAQTLKEKVEIVTKSAAPEPQKQKADDRIYIQPAKNTNNTATTVPSGNSQNDDAIFYACQTIGDYQSYLNTFPQGRHRSQAQAAINNLLNRNDNTANNAEPTSGSINMRNNAQQNLPPRRDRPYNSSVNIQPSNNRGSLYRSGGMQRGGSYRSGGSSRRHSN